MGGFNIGGLGGSVSGGRDYFDVESSACRMPRNRRGGGKPETCRCVRQLQLNAISASWFPALQQDFEGLGTYDAVRQVCL